MISTQSENRTAAPAGRTAGRTAGPAVFFTGRSTLLFAFSLSLPSSELAAGAAGLTCLNWHLLPHLHWPSGYSLHNSLPSFSEVRPRPPGVTERERFLSGFRSLFLPLPSPFLPPSLPPFGVAAMCL